MIKQSAQSENLSLKPEVDTLLVELGVEPISYTCVYRKLKLGRSDGEARRGSGVNE